MREIKMAIKLYSTKTCIWCQKVREFFREHKIKFKDIDVGANLKAAQEMIRKTGQQGVPVIDVNGQIVIGFDKIKLESFIKKK